MRKRGASRIVVALGLVFLVGLVGAACGAAAEPTATPTKAPAVVATPTAAPAVVATPTAAPAVVATPIPTATPVPVSGSTVPTGKLTIMVGSFGNERFDRVYADTAGLANYGRIVSGHLISTNEKSGLIPGIASRWGLSGNGLTWTFTIRKGVKFHDGAELTPQDVLWTLQHVFGPQAFEYATVGESVAVSRAMDKIELSGPDEVSLTTKQPRTDLAILVSEAGALGMPIMPKRAKLHDTAEEAAYDKNPISAGFMKLKSRVPASEMKFERFDDYYYQPKNGFPEDRRVNFQSLEMFLVPEEATRVATLRAGRADIVPASLQTRKQVEAGDGRLVFSQEGVVPLVTLMGCYEPRFPCRDKRVRQALDYAIDKELMRDRLFGGPEVFQVKGWPPATPSTIGYSPGLDPRPFDPAKARQLLADAGYPGGKGFGKLIVNTHASAAAIPVLVESAQLAADFWRRELGLEVEVKVGDRTNLVQQGWKGKQLDGQILWWDGSTYVDATSVVLNRYGDPKSLTALHQDPELFRLVQGTLSMVNPAEQAKALAETYLRLRDEGYEIGLGYVNIPWAVGPRVLTWRPYPRSTFPSALHTISLK